jgi:hypothetical protein
MSTVNQAVKRRKITAQSVSPGQEQENDQALKGRKKLRHGIFRSCGTNQLQSEWSTKWTVRS